jgi:hypothetical protein
MLKKFKNVIFFTVGFSTFLFTTPPPPKKKCLARRVWGGGLQIVALAIFLRRQIVVFERFHGYSDKNVIYLKEIAWFGPHTTSNPIYILSANQRLPMEFGSVKNNRFLAVFPSQPL